MWAGIAGSAIPNNGGYEVSISIHDSVYNTDFASTIIPPNQNGISAKQIEEHVIESLRKFSSDHVCKFLGAGLTLSLLKDVHIQYPWCLNVILISIAGTEPLHSPMVGFRRCADRKPDKHAR